MNKIIFSALLLSLALGSCTSDNQKLKEIEAVEQRLATQFTNERSDTLVNLYRNLVKAHPDDHANNVKYLSRAAEVQFTLREDGVSAARWLDDVFVHHAKGQDIAYPVEVYARIWNAFKYKTASTFKLDAKDVNKMVDHLRNNIEWMDTVLVRLDKQVNVNGQVADQKAVTRFIEVAEGYGALTGDINKFVDLQMKAAGLAKSAGQFNKAVQLYSRVSDIAPERARVAMFMQGFIYENDLNDLVKAKAAYEAFLAKYPDDPDYADDARLALKMLGKSPEEIVKGFEKQ